jgi:hypothetical protein
MGADNSLKKEDAFLDRTLLCGTMHACLIQMCSQLPDV